MDQAKSTTTATATAASSINKDTGGMINGGLDSELAITGMTQDEEEEGGELTVLGISLPVLIGAAAGGVGLLLIMLILVLCLSRKK